MKHGWNHNWDHSPWDPWGCCFLRETLTFATCHGGHSGHGGLWICTAEMRQELAIWQMIRRRWRLIFISRAIPPECALIFCSMDFNGAINTNQTSIYIYIIRHISIPRFSSRRELIMIMGKKNTFSQARIRLWLSQQRSEPPAFSRSTSPAKSEQTRVTSSPPDATSSCKTRSAPRFIQHI